MTIPEKLRGLAVRYGQANLSLYSTSGAYYLFFSLGPLIVIILGLLPYLPFTEQELLDTLLQYAPESFRRLVETLVTDIYAGSATALGIGLVTELWSAGRFLALVMRGVGQIYDGRSWDGYFRRRLLGAAYTAILILLILANMGLLLFGGRLLSRQQYMPLLHILLRSRGLLFFALVTLVNALLYCHIPHRKLHFRQQLPGAAFAAAAWLAFSSIYSWAVERFRFFSVYGGLAIVIISLFWMYCSLYLLFLGAWLNTLLENEDPCGSSHED